MKRQNNNNDAGKRSQRRDADDKMNNNQGTPRDDANDVRDAGDDIRAGNEASANGKNNNIRGVKAGDSAGKDGPSRFAGLGDEDGTADVGKSDGSGNGLRDLQGLDGAGNKSVGRKGLDDLGGDTGSGGTGPMNAGVGKGKGAGKSNPFKGAGKYFGDNLKGFGRGIKTAGMGGGQMLGQNLLNAFRGGASGFGRAVSNVVGKVATGLGIPKVAASVLSGAIVFGAVGGGGMFLHDYLYEQNMMKQEAVIDDCSEDGQKAAKTSLVESEGDEESVALKVWAVMKALGLNDYQAAGAVGNLIGESGADPFTFEAYYKDKYKMTEQKVGWANDINTYTENVVFPAYNGSGISLNKAFYRTSRHGAACGVGIFQFTGLHYDALEDWAAGLGKKNWWCDGNLDEALAVQLSFAIAPKSNGGYQGTGTSSSWLLNWKNENTSSVHAAVHDFCLKYEGNSMISDAKYTAGQKYYDKFKGTMGDTAYAASILEMAKATAGTAAGNAEKNADEECGVEKDDSLDNSDLAKAAVAYAYRTTPEGKGNNGTALYQAVHKAVLGAGDPYFMSCDRGVASAVRWSDADDDFPAGPCTQIIAHCTSDTDHWERVGKGAAMAAANELKPGDVCVSTGHVVMYVGNELIKEKYPDAPEDYVMVSASLNERSPGCEPLIFSHDSRDYTVYRLKHYDEGDKYKNSVPNWQSLGNGKN